MRKLFTFILFSCLMATTALAGQFDQYRGQRGYVVSEDGTWCLYVSPYSRLQAVAGEVVGGEWGYYGVWIYTEEAMTVHTSYTTSGEADNGFKAYDGDVTTTWSNTNNCYSAKVNYEFDATGANGGMLYDFAMTLTAVLDNGDSLSTTVTTNIRSAKHVEIIPKALDFGYLLPDSVWYQMETLQLEYSGYDDLTLQLASGSYEAFNLIMDYYPTYLPSAIYSNEIINFDITPMNIEYGHYYDTIEVLSNYTNTVVARAPIHYCVSDTIPEIIEDTIPETVAGPALISTEHVFSIAPGKKVVFTRGNLYWDGFDWALERKQTDRATTWNENHISHLYWTNTGDEAHALYAPDRSTFSLSDHLFCDGSDADHYLSIEGEDSLYCLSRDEWTYLLNEYNARPYNSRLVKYPVSVDGVDSCIVVAPDDFKGTISDVYTANDMHIIEEAGMLVLPPTGHRYAKRLLDPTTPRYWTSHLTDVESMASDFYAFWTDALGYGLISTICHTGRSYASGIRLAKEVNESTVEIRVKVPECGPISFNPVITGVPGEDYLIMTRDDDGWDYYILPTPQSGVELNMEIRDFARRGNYLLRTDTVPGTRFGFSCITGGKQVLEFDLTEGYEWQMCDSLLNDTNMVWDMHIWLDTYEVGDTIPATAVVTIEKTNTTYTDTIAINWRLVGGQIDPQNPVFLWHEWYYPGFDYTYIRDTYGAINFTSYHWHYGPYQETILHQTFSGPTIEMNGITNIKNSTDMTVYTGETVTMERIFHPNSAVSFREGSPDIYWRFIIDSVRYDIHAGDTTLGVTVITNDTMTVCTFPASLLGPGEYKVDGYIVYDSYLPANPSNWKHNIDAVTIHLTIQPGAEIAVTTQGTATYDEETATITLTDAVIENTEIAITVGAEDAVIEVSGTTAITAEQIGIDCATSVEITAADDADPDEALLITAERPIYTAADDITLTVSGVNMELECPLAGPESAREAFLAPRRAIEARHAAKVADYSVISGFEDIDLHNCYIAEPAGAYYDTDLREMVVDNDGEKQLVKHLRITRGSSVSTDLSNSDAQLLPQKTLDNGHVVILQNGHRFSILGQQLH